MKTHSRFFQICVYSTGSIDFDIDVYYCPPYEKIRSRSIRISDYSRLAYINKMLTKVLGQPTIHISVNGGIFISWKKHKRIPEGSHA